MTFFSWKVVATIPTKDSKSCHSEKPGLACDADLCISQANAGLCWVSKQFFIRRCGSQAKNLAHQCLIKKFNPDYRTHNKYKQLIHVDVFIPTLHSCPYWNAKYSLLPPSIRQSVPVLECRNTHIIYNPYQYCKASTCIIWVSVDGTRGYMIWYSAVSVSLQPDNHT